ncbi:hypothetical protein OSQ98_005118 [Escherichia coli]|nr:hypothetical protein [Escherichia coli]
MSERLKTHSKTQKKSADLVSNKLRIGVFQQYQMKCKSVSKKSPRYIQSVPEATSAALHIFYDMAIPYEPYGDLTMAHSLPVLPATDTAHSLMSIPAC